MRIDVPPFIKADRDPLSYMGLNSVGLTRRGFEKERIDDDPQYLQGNLPGKMNFSQALESCGAIPLTHPTTGTIYLNLSVNRRRGIIRAR